MSSNQPPSQQVSAQPNDPVRVMDQASSRAGPCTASPPVTTFHSGKRPFDEMAPEAGSVPSSSSPSGDASNNFVRKAVGKDGEPLSEKKLRRLEKNRLSARECRRRKREATENMERQINLLEGENLRLRLQLQVGDEAQATMHQEQQKLTEGLDDLLKSGASESEIYAKIEEYKEKFADYGRDRRSAIEFHLRNVERLLMPTQTTSVVLATLQGGSAVVGTGASENSTATKAEPCESIVEPPSDNLGKDEPAATAADSSTTTSSPTTPNSSLAPPTDTKALFRHLVNILQVTPEQAVALKDSRFVAQEMDEILKETLSVLEELRSRLTQCGEDLETEFNNIRAILTPSQSAKFLVWVAQNKACMHMLNELWSKVYPSSHNTSSSHSDDGNGHESSP